MSDRFDYSALHGAGRVLCAVSGGADSVYLLHRCLEGAREHGYAVCAAHYNHCLRGGESERDERFVRALCESWGVECLAGRGDVAAYAAEKSLGTEEAARELRYAFLNSAADALGAELIATAHTADDNAETMLLNLARGAGLRGLCGIPPRRGRLVRPMLEVTRAEVEAYLAERGLEHVEDSTNALDDYSRNRVRHLAVPVLREINPGFSAAVSRAAGLLRRDEEFLESLARELIERNSGPLGVDARALAGAPKPVASRAVRLLAPRALSEAHVEAVLRLAARSGRGFADVPGCRVVCEAGRLRFGSAVPGVLEERPLPLEGNLELPEAGLRVRCARAVFAGGINSSLNTFFFPYENICGTIYCTSARPGDSMRPARRHCTKKLSDLFAEARVPASKRGLVPVLRDEKGVLAVCGLAASERAQPRAGESVLRVEFGEI